MSEMTTKIGGFNAVKRTVAVTFTVGEIVHIRHVNAVVKASGKYDAKATKERVAEVARGVAAKIDLGVIVAPPEEEIGEEEAPAGE